MSFLRQGRLRPKRPDTLIIEDTVHALHTAKKPPPEVQRVGKLVRKASIGSRPLQKPAQTHRMQVRHTLHYLLNAHMQHRYTCITPTRSAMSSLATTHLPMFDCNVICMHVIISPLSERRGWTTSAVCRSPYRRRRATCRAGSHAHTPLTAARHLQLARNSSIELSVLLFPLMRPRSLGAGDREGP